MEKLHEWLWSSGMEGKKKVVNYCQKSKNVNATLLSETHKFRDHLFLLRIIFNHHRKDKGEPTCTFCCQKKKHTCGHGLVGRDASHGDSVSRSLVREASSEGTLQKIRVNAMITYKGSTICEWCCEQYFTVW